MEVVLSLKFYSAHEAAEFLLANKDLGARIESVASEEKPMKEAPKAQAPKAEKAEKKTAAKKPAAAKVDVDGILNETREIVAKLLASSAAAVHKAKITSLVADHGGVGKASTIPDANLPAFIEALRAYVAEGEEPAEEQEEEESLV